MKGVSLGAAAVFLVALVAGHFKGVAFQDIASWQESLPAVDHYFKLVQNLGLVLFVTSVGLIAGPSFFKNLKKNAKSYVALGGIIIITGCLVCAAITLLVPNINSSMSVGLFAGALTSNASICSSTRSCWRSKSALWQCCRWLCDCVPVRGYRCCIVCSDHPEDPACQYG